MSPPSVEDVRCEPRKCGVTASRAFEDLTNSYLDSDYSLRDFHDAVLWYGGLPVSLMRWGMGLNR